MGMHLENLVEYELWTSVYAAEWVRLRAESSGSVPGLGHDPVKQAADVANNAVVQVRKRLDLLPTVPKDPPIVPTGLISLDAVATIIAKLKPLPEKKGLNPFFARFHYATRVSEIRGSDETEALALADKLAGSHQ